MAKLDTITIEGAGKSVTVTEAQWEQATQMTLPFPVNKVRTAEFLDRYLTLEDEIARLQEEVLVLKEEYKGPTLRAVLTAVKVVRTRKKLAEHAKEPMAYELQAQIEGFVAAHMEALDAAKKEAAEEAERQAQRAVPQRG